MPALPLALGWIAAVGLAFADGRRRATGVGAILALAAIVAALCWSFATLPPDGAHVTVGGGWDAGVGIALRADALGVTFAILSTVVLLAVAVHEVRRGVEERPFPALLLFLAVGLCGVFLTGDAFSFYVFFEVSMVSSFVLAGYGSKPRELRAASIFTVVNLLGSALFLGAVVAIYRTEGTLDLAAIAASQREPAALAMPAVLLLSAFGLKLGLFPFHYWVPSVYVGTRPAVAAVLAGALANIAVYGFLRLGAQTLPEQLASGRGLLVVLGATTVIYGSLLAVSRRKIREALAYSSVSQAGYLMIAIGIGTHAGYAAAVVYTIVNSLDKTLLFLTATGGRSASGVHALGALSVAGVPPLAGFVAKLALFRAVLLADEIALVVVIAVGSALSLAYMFQAYQHVFWADGERNRERSPRHVAVAGIVGVLLLGLGIWPEPLLALGQRAADVIAENR